MDGSTTLAHLQGFLPAPLSALVYEYVLRPDAPLPAWTRTFAQQVVRGADAVSPYTSKATAHLGEMITPVLDRIAQAFYNSPDVVVLFFVLVLVVVAFQVLSMLRRLVAWWTRIAMRLLMWAAVGLVIAAIWQRGLERSLQDLASIVGRLLGYAAFVRDIWQAEYQKYQEQQQQATQAAQAAYHSTQHQARNYGGAYRPVQAPGGGWSGR